MIDVATPMADRIVGWSSVVVTGAGGIVAQVASPPDSVVGQTGLGVSLTAGVLAVAYLLKEAKEPITTWLQIAAVNREARVELVRLRDENAGLKQSVEDIRAKANVSENANLIAEFRVKQLEQQVRSNADRIGPLESKVDQVIANSSGEIELPPDPKGGAAA